MKRTYFINFLLLVSSALMAAVPGDLNNDGKLDFADYVHLKAMQQNYVTKTDAADLNFDGVLDDDDAELMKMAIRGKNVLPELLAKTLFGGKLSGGGLTVDIPTSAEVALSTLGKSLPGYQQLELKKCGVTQPVIVSGLPCTEGISFTLDVPSSHISSAGKPMLLVGTNDAARGSNEQSSWHYRLLDVDSDKDLTYTSGRLLWKPQALIRKEDYYAGGGSKGYATKSVPIVLAVVYAKEATHEVQEEETRAGDDFTFIKILNIFDFSGYRTDHFVIQPYDAYPVATLKAFAKELEKAYSLIGALGFDQNYKDKWGESHIRVNILKPGYFVEKEYSVCSESFFWGAPVLEFGGGKMTAKDRAESAIHELMHFHHHIYASHYNALWLDEMCTTWAEYLITDNPAEYTPSTFNDPRAVVNCIAHESSRWNIRNASVHGYNLVPFAKWLTDVKYPGKQFWPKVFSSSYYKSGSSGDYALRAAIWNIDEKADIGELYSEFISDYFGGKDGFPRVKAQPLWFYYLKNDSAFGDFFGKNGMLSEIKSASDLILKENHSHVFQFNGLSAATWRIRFKKPVDYLGEYTKALITFNNTKLQYYIVTSDQVNINITKPSDIKIDEANGTATYEVSLQELSQTDKYSYIGIIAVSKNMLSASDSCEVTVDFSGPFEFANQIASRGYYQKDEEVCMKMNVNVKFTPLNDTVFKSAYLSDLKMANTFKFPYAVSVLGDNFTDTFTFNITGIMADEYVPAYKDLYGELRWARFSGYYLIRINDIQRIDMDWDIDDKSYFKTPGHGWATPYGVLYSAEEFLPVANSKMSDLNIIVKNVKPDEEYNLSIQALYYVMTGENDIVLTESYDEMYCLGVIFKQTQK